jgi:hypothetical protein
MLAKNNQPEGFEKYVKAAETNKNDFTTPRFLLKAGRNSFGFRQKKRGTKIFH